VKAFVFIQARMGSFRLPGKALKEIDSKPLLQYCIERLQLTFGANLVVLTSVEKKDDVLENWCKENKVHVYRGSERNVLERYFFAAKEFDADHIIRATGDNPLVEPYFAKNLLNEHINLGADYSSNKSEIGSNLPDGLGVEIFTKATLEKLNYLSSSSHHFEHVNEYLLENKSDFKIYKDVNQCGLIDKSDIRLTVDTEGDFLAMKKIISKEEFSLTMDFINLMSLL
jgi:spore coat polysaccharide biosynthesis protein SpsF (cytidylyltransferase family)